MKKPLILIFLFILTFFFTLSKAKAQAFLDLEGGSVSTGHNNVRVPGKGGTNFSLKDDLHPNSQFFYRLKAGYTIKRHTLSFLYAPLSMDSKGTFTKDINFLGITFPANLPMTANARLNTFRLTYRFDFIKNQNFEFGLGVAGAYRDAGVTLKSTLITEKKDDNGFFPLLNLRTLWQPDKVFGILIDGDAYLASQGRAEDVLFAANFKFSKNVSWRVGYRMLEGVINSNSLYTSNLFNFISTGLTFSFP